MKLEAPQPFLQKDALTDFARESVVGEFEVNLLDHVAVDSIVLKHFCIIASFLHED